MLGLAAKERKAYKVHPALQEVRRQSKEHEELRKMRFWLRLAGSSRRSMLELRCPRQAKLGL
jgi:hypothetical protein